MKNTREIYYIIFNKHLADGRLKADSYQLEIESGMQEKVPKSITIRDNKVTVTFTDDSRHVFPYNENVEYFDRLIEKKDK
jgi:hypothetical protein